MKGLARRLEERHRRITKDYAEKHPQPAPAQPPRAAVTTRKAAR